MFECHECHFSNLLMSVPNICCKGLVNELRFHITEGVLPILFTAFCFTNVRGRAAEATHRGY